MARRRMCSSFFLFQTYLIDNDSEVHPYVLVCSSTHFMFFSLTIYIIEGALVSFGVFLAFETRRVCIPTGLRAMFR